MNTQLWTPEQGSRERPRPRRRSRGVAPATGIGVHGYDCHISYAHPGGMFLDKITPEG